MYIATTPLAAEDLGSGAYPLPGRVLPNDSASQLMIATRYPVPSATPQSQASGAVRGAVSKRVVCSVSPLLGCVRQPSAPSSQAALPQLSYMRQPLLPCFPAVSGAILPTQQHPVVGSPRQVFASTMVATGLGHADSQKLVRSHPTGMTVLSPARPEALTSSVRSISNKASGSAPLLMGDHALCDTKGSHRSSASAVAVHNGLTLQANSSFGRFTSSPNPLAASTLGTIARRPTYPRALPKAVSFSALPVECEVVVSSQNQRSMSPTRPPQQSLKGSSVQIVPKPGSPMLGAQPKFPSVLPKPSGGIPVPACVIGRPADVSLVEPTKPTVDNPRREIPQLGERPCAFPTVSPCAAPSQEAVQLRFILSSEDLFSQYSQQTFARFDLDANGAIDLCELLQLVAHLSCDFGFREPSEFSTRQRLALWDYLQVGTLNFECFSPLYFALLREIVDTLDPLPVRREWFVSKDLGSPHDTYRFLKPIGVGAFGVVHLVEAATRVGDDAQHLDFGDGVPNGSSLRRVCKVVDKFYAHSFGDLEGELQRLWRLEHPNVKRLVDYYEDFKNIYIVLHAAEGGDLEQALVSYSAQLSEVWLANVVRQILRGVAYCHSQRVLHRDIKPASIMFLSDDYATPHVVVADFGLSILLSEVGTLEACGLPGFIAPELWGAAMGQSTYDFKCDVYSVGAIFFMCASGGHLPFMPTEATGKTVRDLAPYYLAMLSHSFEEQLVPFCAGPSARALVTLMLQPIPKLRSTALECLEHPFAVLHVGLGKPYLKLKQVHKVPLKHQCSYLQQKLHRELGAQIPPNKLLEASAFFNALDCKSDGVLSLQQLVNALTYLGADKEAAEKAIAQLDVDMKGRPSYAEFVAEMVDFLSRQYQEALWVLFCKYETGRSGYISLEELEAGFLGRLEEACLVRSREEALWHASKLVATIDREGDRIISFDELARHLNFSSMKDVLMPHPSSDYSSQADCTDRRPAFSPARSVPDEADHNASSKPRDKQCDGCIVA